MSLALIGLGSNLGDRRRTLTEAVGHLAHQSGVQLSAASRWYQTRPVGGPAEQGAYLNGAALLETSLPPEELLARLLKVEGQLGRRRGHRWEPRTVDLDLLLYNGRVIDQPGLAVPHPRMAWRRFVLEPAAEIAPSLVHPTTGWTIARLLEHLNSARDYLAITGPPGAGKTELAHRLAVKASAELLLRPNPPVTAEDDSPGSVWATQIQFLRQWSRLLAGQGAPWVDHHVAVVSDFWFDQCRAYAEVSLPEVELEAFRQKWDSARQRVVQPKLVVFLDPPLEAALDPVDSRGIDSCGRGWLARLGEAIRWEAGQPGKGPVLRLTNAKLAQAEAEVLTALQSMR